MKIKLLCVIILGLISAASNQAESKLFGLFPSDSLPKLLPGGIELALTGHAGIVGIYGTMGFKGKTAPVHVGFSDIPKNLGPGLMGTLEVGKGAFFLMSDVMYAKLSPSVESTILDVALDVRVFSADILVGYQVAHARGSIDFFAGGKYTSMDITMALDLGPLIESRIETTVSQLPPPERDPVLRMYPRILASTPVSALLSQRVELSPAWVDLLAGARLSFDLGRGVRFACRGEAGGLVAFMWDVIAGLDFQLSRNIAAAIEYRYLHYSYEKEGSLAFHAGMTGPAIALRMKF
jgi:hypothetical protein